MSVAELKPLPKDTAPVVAMIGKSVQVQIEFTPNDVLRAVEKESLVRECRRRGIILRQGGDDQHEIAADDMDQLRSMYHRRDVVELALYLERVMPRDFRGLGDFISRACGRA